VGSSLDGVGVVGPLRVGSLLDVSDGVGMVSPLRLKRKARATRNISGCVQQENVRARAKATDLDALLDRVGVVSPVSGGSLLDVSDGVGMVRPLRVGPLLDVSDGVGVVRPVGLRKS
jgi:hypothetical protein